MTDGRPSRAGWWLTLVLYIAMVVAGRLTVGPTFGFVLFALVWTPLAAIFIDVDGSPTFARIWLPAVVAFVGGLPFWVDDRLSVAASLHLILVAGVIATAGWQALLSGFQTSATARAAVSIGWLAWLIVPLVAADRLSAAIGESAFGRVLSVHPLLAANSAAERAGDWTHSAIAYRWLTRLGQDVAFDLPTSALPTVVVHVIVGLCAIIVTLRRHRGTLRSRSSA